ncbi:MAG TPA: aminotransferase class I/II-fold pyridoxal phosphate-dependent enzyme [Gammaproteobacteria bacterium]|nr:aminotransferase class I/II-fold pyridoxal phosphate-dependent enzyme [Gammaproteobacteria bacterium]HIL61845.1 aminotransferase class I/II-fold pyridoxal phosphate-dependent enzyme [Porticoccaceae bacterium]
MQSKLPDVGTTIFTVMSKMAQDYGAINLSQGFPDFDCPDRLKELVTKYLYDRKNQYPPMAGIPGLREQIAEKLKLLYQHSANPETEITVTSGATEALFDAIQATVCAGDEVIVFDPAYDSYEPAIILAGARAVHVPMTLPEYNIDWDDVAQAITDNTRLIIINTPHNPCGSILAADDLDKLAALIRDRQILVLSDEVYEHMVYDGLTHQSVLGHDELKEKSFAVFSFGKTYHATGWKLAYCVAPQLLTQEFRKVHQFVTFTTSSFVQYAIADFMAECPEHTQQLPKFYAAKRDTFCRLIADSRLKFTPSKGTYFQLVDYSEISDMPDVEFANYLTRERGVAAIPLAPFYQTPPATKILRFCFCKDDATLEQGAAILCKL